MFFGIFGLLGSVNHGWFGEVAVLFVGVGGFKVGLSEYLFDFLGEGFGSFGGS